MLSADADLPPVCDITSCVIVVTYCTLFWWRWAALPVLAKWERNKYSQITTSCSTAASHEKYGHLDRV